jgi:hypothetical protein
VEKSRISPLDASNYRRALQPDTRLVRGNDKIFLEYLALSSKPICRSNNLAKLITRFTAQVIIFGSESCRRILAVVLGSKTGNLVFLKTYA